MTHEQVDELEKKLRDAEKDIEAAAQMVCSEREEGLRIWTDLNHALSLVQESIHRCYALRPEG